MISYFIALQGALLPCSADEAAAVQAAKANGEPPSVPYGDAYGGGGSVAPSSVLGVQEVDLPEPSAGGN